MEAQIPDAISKPDKEISPKLGHYLHQSPFASDNPLRANIGGSDDFYGACSLESFSSASALYATHEDAQGWLDYVTRFKPANFWMKDASVQVWGYEDTYDNWLDSYGTDAVMAFYHSGHGNMDANGVFQVPLGSQWDNRDWAFSNQMLLGNSQARYLFWSTCFSLRVFDGHSPIRTWHPVNRGFRMLFGFETVSVDDPNYGKFFWEEWNKNKPFSTAWMDASWRISRNQVPTVVACGANATEAQSRCFNERTFSWAAASSNYYYWRWYNQQRATTAMRSNKLIIPARLEVAEFRQAEISKRLINKLSAELGFSTKAIDQIETDAMGKYIIKDGDTLLEISRDGRVDAVLAQPSLENRTQINPEKAKSIAESALNAYGLDVTVSLQFDGYRFGYGCSGSTEGSGSIDTPHITETTVQFRQVINNLPAVNDDHGIVRITVNNEGKVTALHNSTRAIDKLTDKPKNTVTIPTVKDNGRTTPAIAAGNIEKMFAEKLNRKYNLKTRAKGATKVKTLPESQIVGYDLSGMYGPVVARREYEVDYGDGLKKAYQVTVPVFE